MTPAPSGYLDPGEWVADYDGREWYLRRRGSAWEDMIRCVGEPPENVKALLAEGVLWVANYADADYDGNKWQLREGKGEPPEDE